MARSESPPEKKSKKRRSESGPRDKKSKRKKRSSSAHEPEAEAEAPEARGPKLAFRFAERGAGGAEVLQTVKRRRPKEEELRRRSFTVEELAALAALAGHGLQAVKAQAEGRGPAAALALALNGSRKLGLAEKVLLKAVLEPAEPDEPLSPGPELIKAFGLVPQPREKQAAPGVPPPPAGSSSAFTLPPPPPGQAEAAAAAAATATRKRTVPLDEWPAPTPEAVQQMLGRFPQLDGHCRGSLMNLPPQFALAILWDMDAKGGPEEIRDPQGFVFSAAQMLLRLPVGTAMTVPPMPVAVPPVPSVPPFAGPMPVPNVFAWGEEPFVPGKTRRPELYMGVDQKLRKTWVIGRQPS
ncbi:unnamed protein product [Effrenium voratum]|uniref:Uncharacterized protein n=1 Tax=Effrenium voratum TaxID=2562239 RepID=A0AA36IZX8_9DINO|nr:unnamed protein product [Effrenium voratum]